MNYLFITIFGCAIATVVPATTTDLAIVVMQKQLKKLLHQILLLRSSNNTEKNLTNSKQVVDLPVSLKVKIYTDCAELLEDGYTNSGVYVIQIFHELTQLPVYCDMQTVGHFSNKSGWITIQRRINGELDFDREWIDYLRGFGFPDKEHWIGLKNLLELTQQKKLGKYEHINPVLRIEMQDWDGLKGYVEYDSFSLYPSDFAIRDLGRPGGVEELEHALAFNMYSPFSTYDHNTDKFRKKDCVRTQRGGWWFGNCLNVNPNGNYPNPNSTMRTDEIFWHGWDKLNPKNTAIRYVSIKLQFP